MGSFWPYIQTNTLQQVQDQEWANKKVKVSLKFWGKQSDWISNMDILYCLATNSPSWTTLMK